MIAGEFHLALEQVDLKAHADSTVEDQKRELAIFSITIEVQCLDGSFAFA